MSKSFTLIEIIVAMFLLTVGAGAAFGVIQTTIELTSAASNQLIASYLAQEGVELIRNIRDGNYLKQRTDPEISWDRAISIGSDYRLDYQSDGFPDIGCNLGIGNFLKFNGEFYNCFDGEETKFKRKITVEKPEEDTIKIIVEVSWTEFGRPYQVAVQTNLSNWR
jgi:type II secretory pathway pseudopilin PulG